MANIMYYIYIINKVAFNYFVLENKIIDNTITYNIILEFIY